MKKTFLISMMVVMLASCSHHSTRNISTDTSHGEKSVAIGYGSHRESEKAPSTQDFVVNKSGISGKPVTAMPSATAFRMSGDYSDNIAVTLNSNGELVYFPAPTDITADSRPISLGDGWWLNCQGLGPNSVFTKYTFEEYAALPQVPSPQQIKMEIIPGAKVTQFIELPIKMNQAIQNLEEVKSYIKSL